MAIPRNLANLANKLNTAGFDPGSVIQVVENNYSTQASNNTTTYVDTNLSATITPSSSSNKVLVLVTQPAFIVGGAAVGYGYQANMGIQLLRGATVLQTPASDGGGKYSLGTSFGTAPASGDVVVWGIVTFSYLDSPATTSATTYKTQFAKGTSGMNTAYVNNSSGASRIVLMEIAA